MKLKEEFLAIEQFVFKPYVTQINYYVKVNSAGNSSSIIIELSVYSASLHNFIHKQLPLLSQEIIGRDVFTHFNSNLL
jgi:hypothetical protein